MRNVKSEVDLQTGFTVMLVSVLVSLLITLILFAFAVIICCAQKKKREEVTETINETVTYGNESFYL